MSCLVPEVAKETARTTNGTSSAPTAQEKATTETAVAADANAR
ncbi:hypothetical protein C499_06025 [Halogeometricum borinquense DSM 11551]|uniref:Uncharacterized protein n=1 Tax=Halogeometricum borinquense (strain ATCC 700274 / DSM 11551 / JCM 10706 / KCTC 4070 / PR3) TaxID=469382 RepID=E4NVB8_HALBP|nr:hypothetical protein Hbor_35870 [Halogeometricum borinquense DSM 11551]ELY29392.1 hypothetical protein C499_06025 [Halogeometricum borinquense DSM 11551]